MNDGFRVLAFTLKKVWFCLTINVDSSLFTSGDVFALMIAFPFTVLSYRITELIKFLITKISTK